jgi:cyclopropane fatty-acyl-phospholipid synthase-like methyltransferase
MANLTYNPAIFDAADEASAKAIIVTAEGGETTDERWARETPYLIDLIGRALQPSPTMTILDFGCGIGRLSKAMIERFGCRAIGVDISADMRRLAAEYVAAPGFTALSPEDLSAAVEGGLVVDGAIFIWVLQHCLAPAIDIERVASILRPGGRVFVANNTHRAVPTIQKRWADDGVDVAALLRQRFNVLEEGRLDSRFVPPILAQLSFGGCYEKVRQGP